MKTETTVNLCGSRTVEGAKKSPFKRKTKRKKNKFQLSSNSCIRVCQEKQEHSNP